MKRKLIYLKNFNSLICLLNLIIYLITGLEIFVAAACINVLVLIILEFCMDKVEK